MSESENRQLLIAAAAALLVLGGILWAAQLEPKVPAAPPNISDVSVEPRETQAPVDRDSAGADRKKAAPPPTLITGLKKPSVRPWSQAGAVFTALSARQPAFQTCYDAALKERPKAKGRAILQFDLADGVLSSEVGVELRAIPSIELRDCFAAATPAVDFSAVQGQTRVLWPLLMWPDKGLSVQAPVGPLDGD